MFNLFKKLMGFLIGKIHITIMPSAPDRKVKRLSLRRIVPILLVVITITTILSLSLLYKHYQTNYNLAHNKLKNLKGVKEENKNLKTELVTLTKDTEELGQALANLEKYNNDIRNMIDSSKTNKSSKEDKINIELRTVFSYNQNIFQQGIPMGGKTFRLQYQNSQNLIKSMQGNINKISQKLPEQRKDLNKLQNKVKEYNAELAATPTIWPLADQGKGYISSDFGWRNDPNSSEREFHEGLDIGVWYNTPVLSTAEGKVSFAGWSSGYGWTVKIEHGYGFETLYAHLNRIKVKKGQKVRRRQVIGLSGNSGRSTGPHLHYEVKTDNIPKNPRKYIGG
jgi:murein DD-endopeptidase MepM/ murein hydrolase activator NlpD